MRRVGSILVVAALATVGGCTGFVTGSGSLDVSAERAAVGSDALNASGYELTGSQTPTVNRSFGVAGQERRVNAQIHVVSYTRAPNASVAPEGANASEAMRGAGTLTVVSVPGVNVAGFSLNPLDVLPDDLLFELAGQQGTELQATGSTNVTMFGETVEGRTYRVATDGADLVLERASLTHEGDLVVAIAAYPEGGESPRGLLSEVEHSA